MNSFVAEAVTLDAERCSGCCRCLDSCPTDVFGFDTKSRKAYLAYPADCSSCFLCAPDCPTGAITLDYAINNPRKHSAYDSTDPELLTLDVSQLAAKAHG